ncbi:hypothetical protein [Cupriavidus necator]|uniref:hypothetical protein n=1 Tax=Cupriavidus necator TaxID=106590 RepID=UPI00339DA109
MQRILQNIVPLADVWRNFVPLPTAQSVAGRHAAASEAGDGCRWTSFVAEAVSCRFIEPQ